MRSFSPTTPKPRGCTQVPLTCYRLHCVLHNRRGNRIQLHCLRSVFSRRQVDCARKIGSWASYRTYEIVILYICQVVIDWLIEDFLQAESTMSNDLRCQDVSFQYVLFMSISLKGMEYINVLRILFQSQNLDFLNWIISS